MAEFHENLAYLRSAKGMSQKAMAEAIDVAQSTYSLYEKGAREPNINKIVKISNVLKVSADDLLGTKPVEDQFTALVKCLDDIDRAEVTGVIKQMLKSDKYNKEENK